MWLTLFNLHNDGLVVPGADYELRIQVPADMTCVSAGAAKFVQNGNTLRVTCTPDGESLGWSVRFAKR